MEAGTLRLFALDATREFGTAVAAALGMQLSPHEERNFEDGEHKARPLVSVRGADVYALQSLYGEPGASVNDKLIRILFFLGALKDAGAARVTAVVPYLGYARKDAKTQPRDPISTRYVAALFEAVGTDRLVTLDVHNLAAFQNAFRIPTEHLDTASLFARQIIEQLGRDSPIVVVSPDAGGVKRAERLRQMLTRRREGESGLAFLEKIRSQGRLTTGRLVGGVADSIAVILDDLISTGRTLTYAAQACRAAGARRVYAAATHGLFTGNATQVLSESDLDGLIVTDTVPPFRLGAGRARENLRVVTVAPLFAEAMHRMHTSGSVVELVAGAL